MPLSLGQAAVLEASAIATGPLRAGASAVAIVAGVGLKHGGWYLSANKSREQACHTFPGTLLNHLYKRVPRVGISFAGRRTTPDSQKRAIVDIV